MKKVIVICLIMLLAICAFSYTNESIANTKTTGEGNKIVSLYCWDLYDFNLSKLKEEIDYLGINTLYIQRFSDVNRIDRLKQVMEFAKIYNIDVYLLDGDQDWLTTEGQEKYVYNVIDQANELNKDLDYKIKGVSIDVEFYNLTSNREKRKEMFKTFTEKSIECCNYANSLGLKYSLAFPAWFDEQGMQDELDDFMRRVNYDHIIFMNYSVKNAITKLANEVEIAKKYGTTIVSATEADWVDEAGVGFYDLGIEACIESLKQVEEAYDYENLGICYHHYRPIIDLMERIKQGIENKYELEVSPYRDGTSLKADEATITGDGKTFKPVPGYHTPTGEYVINFYGLEYGKEYTLTVKSGSYMGTKTFTYKKGELDKIQIAYTNIELSNEINPGEDEDKPNPELPEDNNTIVSLYCWEISDFNLSKLKDEIEYLKVNTLYIQRPANTAEIDRLKEIMEFAKIYNLDVFLLDGAIDWLTTGDINNAKELIDEAYELNKILDYKLKGVSLDVEFHIAPDYGDLSHEEQVKTFRTFTENTRYCCDYANERGLGYTMALPVWYDKLVGDEDLERLINYNYDHIAFMNYARSSIMTNLDKEVEIARKHNIKIVSIAELQSTDYVPEDDTFDVEGLGVEACIDTLNQIKAKYNYENLGTSYHYYTPLVKLLERDTDSNIENRYELELYPFLDNNSIKVDEVTISSTEQTYEPIHGYYTDEQTHTLNFYGLEYGKEYTITVKYGNMSATKTFIYNKGELDNLEIAYEAILIETPEIPEEPTEKKVERIVVTTLPDKISYIQDVEDLDLTGGYITIVYDDGSLYITSMQNDDVKVTGFDNSKLGTNTITVEYEGKTATFDVEIIKNEEEVPSEPPIEEPKEKQIEEIYVTTLPNKTEYIQNEEDLDLTGGYVTILYDDGTIDIISLKNDKLTITGFDNSKLGKNTITVEYNGYESTFDITIIEKEENPGEEPGDNEDNPQENPGEKPGESEDDPEENPGEKPGESEDDPEENPGEKPGENEDDPEENPGEKPGESEDDPEENPGEKPGESEDDPEENPGEKPGENEDDPEENPGDNQEDNTGETPNEEPNGDNQDKDSSNNNVTNSNTTNRNDTNTNTNKTSNNTANNNTTGNRLTILGPDGIDNTKASSTLPKTGENNNTFKLISGFVLLLQGIYLVLKYKSFE